MLYWRQVNCIKKSAKVKFKQEMPIQPAVVIHTKQAYVNPS